MAVRNEFVNASVPAAGLAGTATLDFSTLTPTTATTGSVMTTGSTWVTFSTAGQCGMKLLLANAATSGDFATVRMRARSDAAGATVCGNFSASAGANNHGNLSAVQGYAQPNTYTQAGASHIANGVYSCIDATASSSGRRWSLWTDDHSTTKAAAGHYLHRLSYNPTSAGAGIDGVWTIYCPQTDYLMNIEYAAPFMSALSIAMLIKTPDGDKYIRLYNSAS